jgi:hypothetical protein
MSPEEIDRLFGRFDLPRPAYQPEFERKAKTFELAPGLGVHHPFIAPHMVETGDDISISLALTFRTRRSDGIARLHILNHRLRRLGLKPPAIGAYPRRDKALVAAFDVALPLVARARRLIKRKR